MRIKGTIHRLVTDQGRGVIRAAAVTRDYDYAFDRRSLSAGVEFEQLREGQAVTFEENLEIRQGPRAARVAVR